MMNWTFLVVEDDPDGREVVGRILRHHNIAHDTAATAEEALALLEHHQYNGAILDLALPGMDGWTVLTELKNDPQLASIPVVMLTMVEDRNLGFALGATD